MGCLSKRHAPSRSPLAAVQDAAVLAEGGRVAGSIVDRGVVEMRRRRHDAHGRPGGRGKDDDDQDDDQVFA